MKSRCLLRVKHTLVKLASYFEIKILELVWKSNLESRFKVWTKRYLSILTCNLYSLEICRLFIIFVHFSFFIILKVVKVAKQFLIPMLHSHLSNPWSLGRQKWQQATLGFRWLSWRMCRCHDTRININKRLKSVLFICKKSSITFPL